MINRVTLACLLIAESIRLGGQSLRTLVNVIRV